MTGQLAGIHVTVPSYVPPPILYPIPIMIMTLRLDVVWGKNQFMSVSTSGVGKGAIVTSLATTLRVRVQCLHNGLRF